MLSRGDIFSGPDPDAAWDGTCHSCRQQWGCACRHPSAACLALAHSSLHMVCPAEEVVRSSGVCPVLDHTDTARRRRTHLAPKRGDEDPRAGCHDSFMGSAAACLLSCNADMQQKRRAYPSHVPLKHASPNTMAWPHSMLLLSISWKTAQTDISKTALHRQALASNIVPLQRRDWCGKSRQGACLHTPENLAPARHAT